MELKYFLYTRRSTDEEKQALSTESQLEELKKRFGNLHIVETLTEDASAFKPYNRPVFSSMLQRIEKGEAHGIICWHPDRLSRNPIDGAQIIYAIDRGIIKDLKFGSFHFDNSPEGKMMLGFALSQSKYFSEKLGIDVMRGMNKKCSMGHFPGKASVGYRNVRTEDRGRRYIEVDTERFPQVREMWDLLLSGAYTVPTIWKKARNEWGLTMSASRKMPERPITLCGTYALFNNLFYTGYFEWNGERYKGSYTPMITLAEFEKAQRILGKKGKHRQQKHVFAFTGLMRCTDCGCMITAEQKHKKLKKTGGIATYTYYHCTGKKLCTRMCIREEVLLDQFRAHLQSVYVSPRLSEWIRTRLMKFTEADQANQRQQIEGLQRKYQSCVTAMQNLVTLYVSPDNHDKSLLNEEEFKKQKQDMAIQRDKYKELLGEYERNVDTSIERTVKTFEFASNAPKKFEEGTEDMKRLILLTIGSNWTLKDGIVSFTANLPFQKIREGNEILAVKSGRIEPSRFPINQQKEALQELVCAETKVWWPRPGSNW